MFSMPTRRRARRFSLIPAFALVLVCPRASAQTFVQLSDMGENVGPRLTRVITQARVSRSLFGSIGTKVSFIDSGVVYQLVSDPTWARVTVGRWDQYIHEFLNAGGPGGVLGGVQGIDISARRTAFLADHTNGRIVAATLDINSKNLINAQSWGGVFPSPIDVAWDGGTSPLTLQYLFVLDDSIAQVSYWDASLESPPRTFGHTELRGVVQGNSCVPRASAQARRPHRTVERSSLMTSTSWIAETGELFG